MALLDEGCDAREVVRDMPCWRGMGGRYLSTNCRRLGAVGMGGQGSACHQGGSSTETKTCMPRDSRCGMCLARAA